MQENRRLLVQHLNLVHVYRILTALCSRSNSGKLKNDNSVQPRILVKQKAEFIVHKTNRKHPTSLNLAGELGKNPWEVHFVNDGVNNKICFG